jgi:Ca2+-binding EF-hand superfamily protein
MSDDYPGFGEFQDWRRRVSAETSAFTRCLRCFLRGPDDEKNLRAELVVLGFSPSEVNGYMSAGNRQAYALQMLGSSVRKAKLDPLAAGRMDDTLSALCDDVGACERIFKTPIPIIYTRHTNRFVGAWLALLPLAVWSIDPSWNHLVTIPSTMAITFFLLGIVELGQQIEEPFGVLALEAFCDASIGTVMFDMVLAEDKARGLDKVQGLKQSDVWANAFELADENGDGVLSLKEAVAFGVLESEFKLMDTNGDGEISEEEFMAFTQGKQMEAAEAKVNIFISSADRNGDKMLDLSEAKAAGMSESEFKMLDANSDGLLTKEELIVKFGGVASKIAHEKKGSVAKWKKALDFTTKFVKAADRDGDRMLNVEEAKAAGMSESEFQNLDLDSDGLLTEDEILVKFGGPAPKIAPKNGGVAPKDPPKNGEVASKNDPVPAWKKALHFATRERTRTHAKSPY